MKKLLSYRESLPASLVYARGIICGAMGGAIGGAPGGPHAAISGAIGLAVVGALENC